MKVKALLGVMLVFAHSVWANTNAYKPGGTALERYTIVYSAKADANEGLDQASALQAKLNGLTGKSNDIKPSDAVKKKDAVISIGNLQKKGTFDYSVTARRGNIMIDGGSSWALDRAADALIEYVRNHPSASSFTLSGSVDGEFLFPRGEGVNLRILDDNIWDYSSEKLPQAWQDAGIDCRDAARAPEFAQIVRAYMPDVVVLQEYSSHMNNELYPRIEKYGYRNACPEKKKMWNNTPVFYNVDSLDLLYVNYSPYTPSQWNNHGSKSFTSAVFRQKSSDKVFAIINTHLWWKGDHTQPGSTLARASQVRLMMAEAEILRHKYDCPIFITGDMNCEENSIPMQQFLTYGYIPCYKAATVYGNMDNGHHICAPSEVGERKSRRKGQDRQTGAIDHCLIYNAHDAEIKVFDCIQDYFTVKLTDHYPNLIDVKL